MDTPYQNFALGGSFGQSYQEGNKRKPLLPHTDIRSSVDARAWISGFYRHGVALVLPAELYNLLYCCYIHCPTISIPFHINIPIHMHIIHTHAHTHVCVCVFRSRTHMLRMIMCRQTKILALKHTHVIVHTVGQRHYQRMSTNVASRDWGTQTKRPLGSIRHHHSLHRLLHTYIYIYIYVYTWVYMCNKWLSRGSHLYIVLLSHEPTSGQSMAMWCWMTPKNYQELTRRARY